MSTANPNEMLSRTPPSQLQTEPRGEKHFFHQTVMMFTRFFKGFWQKNVEQGSLWVAWGTSQELVRFWNPFSENMSQNHNVLHGLGAGRNLKPDPLDPPDQPDQADPPEVVRSWHLAPWVPRA